VSAAKRGYSYREAATYCGISVEQLKIDVRNGRVPVHYWNSKPLFFVEELDEVLNQLPAEKKSA
jgi:hypothetical protein